jgi:hypothetical protein
MDGPPTALIVSHPLHFVVAVIVPNHLLDALAWVRTAVRVAAAAIMATRFGRVDDRR